jgi:hypothetical protein
MPETTTQTVPKWAELKINGGVVITGQTSRGSRSLTGLAQLLEFGPESLIAQEST